MPLRPSACCHGRVAASMPCLCASALSCRSSCAQTSGAFSFLQPFGHQYHNHLIFAYIQAVLENARVALAYAQRGLDVRNGLAHVVLARPGYPDFLPLGLYLDLAGYRHLARLLLAEEVLHLQLAALFPDR